ncbi:PAS domain-containing protein [Flavobacterium sp. J49]|uniref:PAS domain-containing sensor histidine kinase n=1 Tax=Flavobacterium sp. J49 TaxID=2718534 RepID=UPI0015935B0C|nr:PAS domain-containing sensor histidine kinase [Flavobacterium sp. J49]MBF6639879.1 PAS domain-containing protein [Flavobacterium sp. J49]NIC01124.1 PAS domain-containing protein [Flavobacterium sp. J49]
MDEKIDNLKKIDYQKLFENLQGLYLIISIDFTIIEVSKSYAQATMTQHDKIIGEKLFDVFPDNPQDGTADGVANLRNSLRFVIKNKVPHTMAVQKYDIRKPDGSFEVRYWSPVNKPVLDENGTVLYIIHKAEDVTDFIKLEDEKNQNAIQSSELLDRLEEMKIEIVKRSHEIQKMNNQLEQKVDERTNHLKEANETIKKNISILTTQKKQLEDFCNIISHNLRAPLVNISMLAEMVAENSANDENSILLEKLHKATKNLNETFDELVESIQISQDTEVPSELIDLKSCTMNIIEGLQGEINKTEATIEMDFEAATTAFYPINYMKSILHNLVSNSLKYSSPERKPIIKIASKKIEDKLTISVSDNGLGIDLTKNKDNIFKIRKVFHNHPSAKGFGLFLTKSQVVALGGNIWAESTPDVGSTFFVELINQ